MAIDVLMIVAVRKFAKLPVKAFPASVVLPRRAPTVSPPVSQRFCNLLEFAMSSEDCAPLAHGDMVRRVETLRGEVAKGARVLAVVCGSESVAIVFDQIKVMLFDQVHDGVQIERIAQRVGHHHRTGLRRHGVRETID